MIKLQVAIVNAIVAQFHSNVANFDTRQHLMRIDVPDRHKERLYAVIGLERDASSENNGMCGLDSQISRPEFSSFDCWGMNDKLISVKVECCSGLQSSHIRAMT